MAKKRAKKRVKEIIEETEPQGDLQALVQSLKEKPWHYGLGVAFILGCVFAGMLYREAGKSSQQAASTAYLEAAEGEEAGDVAAELEKLAADAGKGDPRVLYMMAESAYEAGDYEKAKTGFERVRAEFPESDYAPDAVEGLAYIAEDAEKYEDAAASYAEIEQKWPASFAAKRQRFNVARCLERQGEIEKAVEAYQEQVDVFPDSGVAEDAESAMTRLKDSHPDLFPEAPAPEAEESAEDASGEAAEEKPAETPAQ